MNARTPARTHPSAPGYSNRIEGPRTTAWRTLTETIRGCPLCPLARTRTHAVVYRGGQRPWIVFIGEAPGAEEDRVGRPFVGRGGRILDGAIARAGLAPAEFGVLNVLKCRPPANRFDREAARICRPYLDRQLDLLAPRAIVTLGRHALVAMDPGAPPIMVCAGAIRPGGARSHFPLLHPAATLRSRSAATRWRDDVERFAAWIRTVRPPSPLLDGRDAERSPGKSL